MGHYNFRKDLKDSEESVDRVITLLKHFGCTSISKNDDGKYDILYTTNKGNRKTAEVKNDLMFDKTGNVAIEYESRGTPSGISSSKADNWYYVLGDDIYLASLPSLRSYLIQHWDRYKRVDGGDDGTSKLVLLPLSVFKEIFKLIRGIGIDG